jgi:hypothetical protein
MTYRERIADRELVRRLDANGAVVIEGVKACGKTATARQVAASEVLLDTDENARRALAVDPALVLEGAVPRLLDEWQIEPAIWNHVRRAVDDRGTSGQFILTGSAVPADDIVRHTGAGRLTRHRLRPMSLFETGHSSGLVSLQQLLGGHSAVTLDSELPLSRLAEHISVGGWPAHLGRSANQSLQANRDFLNEIRRVDIARVDGIRRDPVKVGRFLHSFARHVGTYAAASTMTADLNNHTAAAYLSALERLMIIEDQPAWAPHLRSRSRLRSTPKRHYVDPSLAVAALRADPDSLMQDLDLLGFLFESLVVRDLRIYAQHSDAEVLQYRDNTGLEVDAIVQGPGGQWAAFEVKLGTGMIDQAAANLVRFAARVDTSRSGAPAALAVIVARGYGYVRPDGIRVIPIGALGP